MWDAIKYDADKYCCEHFLIDAYRHYTGKDISKRLLTSGFFNASTNRTFFITFGFIFFTKKLL